MFKYKRDISIVGFVPITNEKKKKINLCPIYEFNCKSYKELISLLNNQKIKDDMYNITINKLIEQEKQLDIYSDYLKNIYHNSKKMFEDFLKVWLKNILQNPNIEFLPELGNMAFVIY